jgi:uncharacterized protein YukE
VSGDAGAADRLSTAYDVLANHVYAAKQQVAAVLAALSPGWQGPAARAIEGPLEAFLHNAGRLAKVLDEAAQAYSTYSHRLEQAHAEHSWSMHKLLKVGAVTAVSATAIVVTVGAAGAVEAAAAGAAVAGASTAAETGVMADVVAASALDSALESLPTLRPLLSFVLPHLLQAEWTVGAMATWNEATTDRMHWRAVGESGALAFLASGTAARGRVFVGESRWAPHLIEGTVWGGAAGADDELINHRLSVADIAESFVLAGGGPAGRDALRTRGMWPEPPDYRREALVNLLHHAGTITDREIAHELALLRQPVKELERGTVDLRMHEGPGHTIDRHVGKSAAELRARLHSSRVPRASTYWDQAGARDAIEAALTANRDAIRRWAAAGYPDTLRVRMNSAYDVGFVLDRRGTVRFVRRALVVLRRDPAGVVLVTSYPVR